MIRHYFNCLIKEYIIIELVPEYNSDYSNFILKHRQNTQHAQQIFYLCGPPLVRGCGMATGWLYILVLPYCIHIYRRSQVF